MRTFRFLTLLAFALLPAGCQSLSEAMRTSDAEGGRDNPVAEDPWIREAGTMTRSVHPSEPIKDPLGLRDVFTSEKARDIERNLGVGN